MIRVYVAGKLNDNAVGYLKNVHKMCYWDDQIRRVGDYEKYSVFNPCLDLIIGIMQGVYEYKHYFNNNLCWLEVADVVFVCPGWETSEGTKREIIRADELDIPVVYSFEELEQFSKTVSEITYRKGV